MKFTHRIVVLAVIASALTGGIARADHGPGSWEDENRQVQCDHSTDLVGALPGTITVDLLEGDGDARGVEACGETGDPVQGRIYVTDRDGAAVGADGERDTPLGLGGWTRVNGDGTVTCYDGTYPGGHWDSSRNEGNFAGLDCAFIYIQ